MSRHTGCPSAPILLVDDNDTFRRTLATALRHRGQQVETAGGIDEAVLAAQRAQPDRAIVDLNLGPSSSGLLLVPRLLACNPSMRIVIFTGYASIATAVEAIRLGATHYLVKPADADEVLDAFGLMEGDAAAPLPVTPMSVSQLEWEHLQRVLLQHGGNVTATARTLGLHRRSLQRKLRKHARW